MTGQAACAASIAADSMTPKQAAFRKEYRPNIAPRYNGWGHIPSIFIPGVAMIWYCAAHISDLSIRA